MMGLRGGVDDVDKNKFRLEMEDAVRKVGLDFFIGVVPNSKREAARIYAGDMVEAHRQGVDFARKIYRTRISGKYDILVLNAYPKDTDLIQTETAFTPLRTIGTEIMKEKGILIVVSCCSKGLGYHALFGPGMRLYRRPSEQRQWKGRDLIIFSPNLHQREFHTIFWKGYQLVNNFDSLFLQLKERFENGCDVAILPCAPLQLPTCAI